MKMFDRVKFIIDYKTYGDIIIEKGTIGTIRSVEGEMLLIQISNEETKLVFVPDTAVTNVLKSDLLNIDPNTIIPNIFKVGTIWYILDGYDENKNKIMKNGIIKEVILSDNENYDRFVIQFENSENIYEKRFLINHGSL